MAVAADRPAVLIVEDDTLVRFDAMQSFEDAGFEVVDAYAGDQALSILDQRPDIQAIFTDIQMPGDIDGLGLAHAARSRSPGLAVVITSGVVSLRAGDLPFGVVFLPKPYDSTQVAALVLKLIQRGQPGLETRA